MHTANELYHAIGPFLRAVSGERIFDQRPLPEQAKDLIWLYDRIKFSLKRGDALHPRAFEVATLAMTQQALLMNGERRGGDGVYQANSDEGSVTSALGMLEEADRQCWERWAESTPERLREKELRALLVEISETLGYIGRCAMDVKATRVQEEINKLLLKMLTAKV